MHIIGVLGTVHVIRGSYSVVDPLGPGRRDFILFFHVTYGAES